MRITFILIIFIAFSLQTALSQGNYDPKKPVINNDVDEAYFYCATKMCNGQQRCFFSYYNGRGCALKHCYPKLERKCYEFCAPPEVIEDWIECLYSWKKGM